MGLPTWALVSVVMALPMKASAMKGARSMKAKRVTKIARGKFARSQVLRGTKDKLMRNKFGKIVSKKASAVARKRYQSSGIKIWAGCISQARKALNLTGFVAINGKQAEGKALYAKAKALREN